MQPETPISLKSFWNRQAPITVVGVLVLTVVGSILYDILVKPGLTGIGRLVLDVLTLGSTQVLDSSYASAALDPTPVTGMLILQGLITAFTLPAAIAFGWKHANSDIKNHFHKVDEKTFNLPIEQEQAVRARENQIFFKNTKRNSAIAWIVIGLIYLFLLIKFAVHSQSISVWRVFNANMAIIAPVATPLVVNDFKAQFARMKTKADYIVLEARLTKLAAEQNIQLQIIESW